MSQLTDEQWKAVRQTLKTGLLAGETPLDSKAMGPKAVWQRHINAKDPDMQCIDYADKSTHDKFTHTL